ncbi:RNA polymerase II transcription mediator [Seiridium cupressi]
MGDRLTQLQDAVDQVASLHLPNNPKGSADSASSSRNIDPHPAEVFKAAQVELAQDLITKEQQIELLISILPGLENSEQDQERNIKELEEELKTAETQRLEAIGERKAIMSKLDEVIRSVRRP